MLTQKTRKAQLATRIIGGLSAPFLIQLTDYKEQQLLLLIIVIVYLSISSYLHILGNRDLLPESTYILALFLDVTMLSVAIGLRGGIRSDFYLGYYLILSYVTLVRRRHLMLIICSWIIFCYSCIIYFFSDPLLFSFSRIFIRMILMSGTASLLQLLVHELISEENHKKRALNLAFRDPLTNAFNRRMLNTITPELEVTLSRVTTVVLDLDDFKLVNDTYGHDAGDEVIKTLVTTINRHIREVDYCFRLGGEEFLIIFIDISPQRVHQRMLHIQRAFSIHKFDWSTNNQPQTFTAGVAFSSGQNKLNDMINHADEALYKGKTNGKNQIVVD